MRDGDGTLPDDIDPSLSFYSSRCGGDDYLIDGHWHTWPGRMAVYCPHDPDHPNYRISFYELPGELPLASRYWIAGFLAGNLPRPPNELYQYENEELADKFNRLAKQFSEKGYWPASEIVESYFEGRSPFPSFEDDDA